MDFQQSDFNNAGDGFYSSNYDQSYGYDNNQQYGGYGNQGNYGQSYAAPQPQVFSPTFQEQQNKDSGPYTNFDDEPPLLEELGINFDHISLTTKSVLNPFQQTDSNIMDDCDLAGPLVFCVAFGGFLLLSGKVHGFGYIYGVGVLGCLCMYAVLNLMSMTGVTLTCVISILGYCLLPMVLLSGISVVFTLTGTLGTILTGIVILWCSFSASKLFVTVLAMDHQQPLVAYPCALLYGVFALLTVF